MKILLLAWSWAVLLAAGPTTTPDLPPALSMPDLSSVPLVRVLSVEQADVITVQQAGQRVQAKLAWLHLPEDLPAQQVATTFLRNLLTGERVWLVPSGPGGLSTDARWCVYRWPDRLLVNVEMIRQGYADLAPQANGSPAAKLLQYWQDVASRQSKGIWSTTARSSASASQPASTPEAIPSARERRAAASPSAVTTEPAAPVIVYVSASGKKYHRANCMSLRRGGTPVSLEEARKTRQACKQCNPPQ
jgi:hypothetical protein